MLKDTPIRMVPNNLLLINLLKTLNKCGVKWYFIKQFHTNLYGHAIIVNDGMLIFANPSYFWTH